MFLEHELYRVNYKIFTRFVGFSSGIRKKKLGNIFIRVWYIFS